MKYFITILTLLFFSCPAFSQKKLLETNKTEKPSAEIKYKFIYEVSFRPDSTNQNVLKEKMVLLVSDKVSQFRSLLLSRRDSIEKSILDDEAMSGKMDPNLGSRISSMLQGPQPKFNYDIYKFYNTRECYTYSKINNQRFKFKEEPYPVSWKLTNEKLVIDNYKCEKATTSFAGREYEAWFTREIPISDGPYKFSGLPGLIIKINDSKNDYIFKILQVKKDENHTNIIISDDLVIETTKEEFKASEKINKETALNRASQYGVSFKNPEDIRLKIKNNLKKNNNPIELLP